MKALRECLVLIQDLMPFLYESASKRFEALAGQFYQETKIMAPGRSVPLEMAMSQPPGDVRADQYQKWLKQRIKDLHDRGLDKLDRYNAEKYVPDPILEFRSMFDKHEHDAGWASAMSYCYDFALTAGILPQEEKERYAKWEHDNSAQHERDVLRQLHDECCDLGHGKRLDVGPMIPPSERTVLKARAVLEPKKGE